MTDRRRFIIVSDLVRENCIRAIRDLPLPDGKTLRRPWRCVVEKHIEDKRAEQRQGFHFLLGLLSEQTGYSMEEVKDLVVRETLGTKQIRIGSRVQEVRMSTEENDGRKVNVIEYSALIDATYRIAAEAGIVLPVLDPRLRKRRAA